MKATVPRWDGQKTKLSPTAEMLKSISLVQFPAVNCRQLCSFGFVKKKDCSVTTQFSLHSTLKLTAQCQAKVAYTTAFRHRRIHNCITQSKPSRSIMAANVPQLRAIITSHTICTFTLMYCTLHTAATNLNFRFI